jgi:hypothetical protein
MGLVTDYLVKLIQRQVDDNGLVIWSDPQATYSSLAAQLTLPGTRVASLIKARTWPCAARWTTCSTTCTPKRRPGL